MARDRLPKKGYDSDNVWISGSELVELLEL